MSLRVRLTILFTILLGGVLLIFGTLVYSLVSTTLLRQIDNTLIQNAEQLTNLLQVSGMRQFDPRSLAQYRSDENLFFQIYGADLTLQLARPAGVISPLDSTGLQSVQLVFNTTQSNDLHLRVLTVPLEAVSQPVGVLQVGFDLQMLDVTQRTLATVLMILAMAAMVMAGVVAWWVVGQALAPLATATQVATTITRADDLSRRVPLIGNEGEEVETLIRAFNQTLSRLDQLFQTQQRFLADVSHELRTPLTVIKGNMGLMRHMKVYDEEAVISIEAEIDRLTRLVGELLLIAQAESGRLPMERKLVELDTVFLEVYQQMRTLAGEKLDLRLVEIDQIPVMGDRDRLKQVLLNLVGNAVQYTPEEGRVTLALRKLNEQAQIIISDTGPGIPPEDLPHIFERFYRGEKSRQRRKGSGFGLGLSIAYWIVRNHGGTIEVTSELGRGTIFCVWLPLYRDEIVDELN